MANNCDICFRKILSHSKNKKCVICKRKYHCKCITIDPHEISEILEKESWFCISCTSEIFPFNQINDNTDFFRALFQNDHFEICWESIYEKLFNPFTFREEEHNLFPSDDLDPDANFYNDIMQHSSTLCKYYLQSEFNKELASLSGDSLSLCHLNVRSLQHNFAAMQAYLDTLSINFTILGITETWLTDKNYELYNIPNYVFVEKHRTSRSGGGVGLFLPTNLSYKDRRDLGIFSDTLEALFIEIDIDSQHHSKNVVIGVVYRPPGSDLQHFTTVFDTILSKIKSEKKRCYLLGDWNVNLLNYDCHVPTTNVIDMFYSHGFMPLINRPTRISEHSATIIDNIFTNNHTDLLNSYHGILISDISDHFPIFHINKNICDITQELIIVKRSYSDQNKDAFLQQLSNTNWNCLYNVGNVQEAFSTFHETLYNLYDQNFPKRKIKIKHNNYKPWLSESLRICIKRKNHLYYKSIKHRTAYNELMYSMYRNKLKKILMKSEKDYYSKMLEANKGNMKKTWSILKQIINKKKYNKLQTEFKLSDDTITSNKSLISEKFNDFFINIGPTLAEKIPSQTSTPEEYLGSKITNSIFLSIVTAKEFDEIVLNLKKMFSWL